MPASPMKKKSRALPPPQPVRLAAPSQAHTAHSLMPQILRTRIWQGKPGPGTSAGRARGPGLAASGKHPDGAPPTRPAVRVPCVGPGLPAGPIQRGHSRCVGGGAAPLALPARQGGACTSGRQNPGRKARLRLWGTRAPRRLRPGGPDGRQRTRRPAPTRSAPAAPAAADVRFAPPRPLRRP